LVRFRHRQRLATATMKFSPCEPQCACGDTCECANCAGAKIEAIAGQTNFSGPAPFYFQWGRRSIQMEHRCGLRGPVAIKVRLRTRHGLIGDGEISEISASGALLRSHFPVALYSTLVVQSLLPRPHRARAEAQLTGEVVRHVPDGFALEWTEFAPEAV